MCLSKMLLDKEWALKTGNLVQSHFPGCAVLTELIHPSVRKASPQACERQAAPAYRPLSLLLGTQMEADFESCL